MSFLGRPPSPPRAGRGRPSRGPGGDTKESNSRYLKGFHTGNLEEDDKDLTIWGLSAEIFQDDIAAIGVDQERHMIKWRGEEEDPIIIDRYDGRALLDDRSKFIKLKSRRKQEELLTEEEMKEEALIEQERYRDLHGRTGEGPDDDDEDLNGQNSRYGAIGHGYNGAASGDAGAGRGEGGEELSSTVSKADDAPFVPSFDVPSDIELPPTIRVHRLIGMTARKARADPQLEIVLKVKQSDNATFKFLQSYDPLHPYYLFLKEQEREPEEDYTMNEEARQKALEQEERRQREIQEQAERRVKEEAIKKKRAVRSLLGSAYFDEDEEEEEEEVLEPTTEMRAVMEKLVAFVKKNGPAFEAKVKEREVSNPRFSFLHEDDVYHPFYRSLLDPPKEKVEEEKKGDEEGSLASSITTTTTAEGGAMTESNGGGGKIVIELKKSKPKAGGVLATTTTTTTITTTAAATAGCGSGETAAAAAANNKEKEEGEIKDDGRTPEQRRADRLKRAKMMSGHFKIALMTAQPPTGPAPPLPSVAEGDGGDGDKGKGNREGGEDSGSEDDEEKSKSGGKRSPDEEDEEEMRRRKKRKKEKKKRKKDEEEDDGRRSRHRSEEEERERRRGKSRDRYDERRRNSRDRYDEGRRRRSRSRSEERRRGRKEDRHHHRDRDYSRSRERDRKRGRR